MIGHQEKEERAHVASNASTSLSVSSHSVVDSESTGCSFSEFAWQRSSDDVFIEVHLRKYA
jgi:hypothetical protein